MPTITISTTEEMQKRLEAHAIKTGKKKYHIVNEALDQCLPPVKK